MEKRNGGTGGKKIIRRLQAEAKAKKRFTIWIFTIYYLRDVDCRSILGINQAEAKAKAKKGFTI